MSVADDQVLHRRGIQADLPEPVDLLVFGRVAVKRVDHDEPFGGLQRPRVVLFRADEIKVVEDLRGCLIPRVARRRSLRAATSAAPTSAAASLTSSRWC